MDKNRNVCQKATNLVLMCRVCLTQSGNIMYDLSDTVEFHTEDFKQENISIIEVLQEVTSSIKGNGQLFPLKEILLDDSSNLISYKVDEVECDIKEQNCSYNNSNNDKIIESFIIEIDELPQKGCTSSKAEKFSCETCCKIFSTKRLLQTHQKRVHFPKSKIFNCEICGNNSNTRSAYINHKIKHSGKNFTCEICGKPYYTKAMLKVHMGTHTNKRIHLCNVCGKGFNYANALVYHMRLHTGEKNYQCEYCNKRFRMIYSLKRHVRVHTGEKPYKCQYCGKAFSSKSELSCHKYTHTSYRPYNCIHCGKGFSKTHNLKLHLLSHKGSYKCNFCKRSFIELAILSMHYRISHKRYI